MAIPPASSTNSTLSSPDRAKGERGGAGFQDWNSAPPIVFGMRSDGDGGAAVQPLVTETTGVIVIDIFLTFAGL
jgi:hypothetical protein